MITKKEIFNKMTKIISDKEITNNLIFLSSDFINDLDIDSLDLIELIMAFEDEFEIDLPDEEFESIKLVQEVVDFIYNKVNKTEDVLLEERKKQIPKISKFEFINKQRFK